MQRDPKEGAKQNKKKMVQTIFMLLNWNQCAISAGDSINLVSSIQADCHENILGSENDFSRHQLAIYAIAIGFGLFYYSCPNGWELRINWNIRNNQSCDLIK